MTNNKNIIKDVSSIASTALFLCLPIGLLLSLFLKSFNEMFPSWFFYKGLIIQILLYLTLFTLVIKKIPKDFLQVLGISIMMIFSPVYFEIIAKSIANNNAILSDVKTLMAVSSLVFPAMLLLVYIIKEKK